MKKAITVVLSAICAVLFAFGLAACKNKDNVYEITVKSVGGIPLSDVIVSLYKGKDLQNEARTDNRGVARLKQTAGTYTVQLDDLPRGYQQPSVKYETSADKTTLEIPLMSSVITNVSAPQGLRYDLGNVMYDFTLTSSTGNTFQLSKELETNKAVLVNFWATYCGPCKSEFPALANAYESFNSESNKDHRISVIAVSNYDADTAAAINAYIADELNNEINFPMAPDTASPKVSSHFNTSSIPVSIIIDRYGVFAYAHTGSITDEEQWLVLFDKYTSDDYRQDEPEKPDDTLELPDVTMPPSAELEAAANGTGFNGTYRAVNENDASDYQYYWPWLAGTDANGSYIYASNVGKQKYSTAWVYVSFDIQKDQMLVFDYDISIETDLDMFYVIGDGEILYQDSGIKSQQQAYVYVALEAGKHQIAFVYRTDQANEADAVYTDLVKIRNIRLVDKSTLPDGAYIDNRYHCATDMQYNEAGKPIGWNNYVSVGLGEDGYYHLLDENKQPTGPYVLADLQSPNTHWSNNSVISYLNAGTTLLSASDNAILTQYANYAANSDIRNFTPVTAELQGVLDRLTKAHRDNTLPANANEWLEICSYYIHYGTAGEDPNAKDPISGCAPFNAVELHLTPDIDANNYQTVGNRIDITRVYVPRGIYTKFIPAETGLYLFRSFGKDKNNAEINTLCYITDANGNEVTLPSDTATQTTSEEPHFSIYVNLERGKTYYVRCDFYMPGELGTFYVGIEQVHEAVDVIRPMTTGQYTYDLDAYDSTGKYYYRPSTVPFNYMLDPVDGENWIANYAVEDMPNVVQSNIYLQMLLPTNFCSVSIKNLLTEQNDKGEPTKYYYMTRDERGDPIVKKDANGNPIYETNDKGEKVPVYEETYRLDFDFRRDGGKNYNARMEELLAEAEQNEGLVPVTKELAEILTWFAHRISIWRTPDGDFLDEPSNPQVAPRIEWIGMCYYFDHYEP